MRKLLIVFLFIFGVLSCLLACSPGTVRDTETTFEPAAETPEPTVQASNEPEQPVQVEKEPPVEIVEIPVLTLPELAPEPYDSDTVEALAKCVYGEAGGLPLVERAAVIWCVLNYVDGYDCADIMAQLNFPNRFQGYRYSNPVTEENVALVKDVLIRWQIEKDCIGNVGRVLPKEYLYFIGDGKHNYFRDQYVGGNIWDWSLPNPYEGVN